MKLIDYLFYRIFAMGHFLLKKNVEDSKFSAVLFISVFTSFFIGVLIEVSGLVYPNKLSHFYIFKDKGMLYSHFLIGILLAVILYRRYFKTDTFKIISKKYKRAILIEKIALILLFCSILLCMFLLYRYQKFGLDQLWHN